MDQSTIFITINAAAERIGLSPETVRQFIREGRLKAAKFGRRSIRVRVGDLERFIESSLTGGDR